MTERIDVAVEWDGVSVAAGVLRVNTDRELSCDFAYESEYLSRPWAYPLDPALPLSVGSQHTRGLPGAFSDSAPDRWGRNLIRRQLQLATPRNRRQLTELDFLLGVSDQTRQGALRFSRGPGGDYLSPGTDVPKLITLPKLLRAADRLSREEAGFEDVKVLLDAGSGSLGGARPKASVMDDDGLVIAKFPHPQDRWDVIAWEATALDLAEAAGLRTPHRRLLHVGDATVLLVRRFDRDRAQRIGYQSALSLVGGRDGEALDYLDVVEAMRPVGASPARDLKELWARVLFGVRINNTDDHLRNHGFLRRRTGWELAPVFDVNTDPEAVRHQTSIAGATTREDSLEMLNESAEMFGLTASEVAEISARINRAVSGWRATATINGVPKVELELMAEAFAF